MKRQLRRCPFCGATNVAPIWIEIEVYWVQCPDRGMTGPTGKTEREAIAKYENRYFIELLDTPTAREEVGR
jgi:hypothetical protein